jgi:soluble lytic murein transglycosylase-like protein
MKTEVAIFILAGLLIAYLLLGGNSSVGIPFEVIIMKYANQNVPSDMTVGDFVNLIRAVITKESNWNQNAVSPTGDIGLMQINPVNAPAFGVTTDQLYDPDTNIMIGTTILGQNINRYGLIDGLAAYNGGPANRKISVTQRYAQDVINIYNSLQTV